MIRLTEKEIRETVKADINDYKLEIPTGKQLGERIAQAQIKKIYECGNEKCPHKPQTQRGRLKRQCDACWYGLRKSEFSNP